VNYASSVYSVFFVDLAQLIIVLAIAKPLSPTLHHLPTTIKLPFVAAAAALSPPP
jgi:hypothetical protein